MKQFVLYCFKLMCYFHFFSVTAFEIMPLSLILDIGLYLYEQYFMKRQSYQKYTMLLLSV